MHVFFLCFFFFHAVEEAISIFVKVWVKVKNALTTEIRNSPAPVSGGWTSERTIADQLTYDKLIIICNLLKHTCMKIKRTKSSPVFKESFLISFEEIFFNNPKTVEKLVLKMPTFDLSKHKKNVTILERYVRHRLWNLSIFLSHAHSLQVNSYN